MLGSIFLATMESHHTKDIKIHGGRGWLYGIHRVLGRSSGGGASGSGGCGRMCSIFRLGREGRGGGGVGGGGGGGRRREWDFCGIRWWRRCRRCHRWRLVSSGRTSGLECSTHTLEEGLEQRGPGRIATKTDIDGRPTKSRCIDQRCLLGWTLVPSSRRRGDRGPPCDFLIEAGEIHWRSMVGRRGEGWWRGGGDSKRDGNQKRSRLSRVTPIDPCKAWMACQLITR